jgi:carboxypeptidase D
MTWGGAQGFHTPIESENFIVKDMGVYGNMHTERKLTCAYLLIQSQLLT